MVTFIYTNGCFLNAMQRCFFVCLLVFLFAFRLNCQPIPADSLRLMLGQMIGVGLGSVVELSGDAPILQALNEGKIGAVVLFTHNIAAKQGAAHLRKLVATLQLASRWPLWIGIDEEGGMVNRLKPSLGFIPTLSAAAVAKQGMSVSKQQAESMAKQLNALGINLNFAPVVDLNINPSNPIIGRKGRSFGSNAQVVFAHAQLFIDAHRAQNVATTLKHFPGHGASTKDSHLGQVDISAQWHNKELEPYRMLTYQTHLFIPNISCLPSH